MINYNNLFFKTVDPSIKNFDFFKRFSTLYGLLIDLFNEQISTLKAEKQQKEMIDKIEELKDFILLKEKVLQKKKKKIHKVL